MTVMSHKLCDPLYIRNPFQSKWTSRPLVLDEETFIVCVAGDSKNRHIDYCKMEIDDCDERAQCVLDQKKIRKKKINKSKLTDGENFYKCKCRDLLTDISKIKGMVK